MIAKHAEWWLNLGQLLLRVLLVLPLVAARLLLVLGGVLIIALGAMLALGCFQQISGLHIDGVSDFSLADLREVGTWLAATLLAMAFVWLSMRGMERLVPRVLAAARPAVAMMRRRMSGMRR